VTVGGCCWAVEPTIRRSLFYEVNGGWPAFDFVGTIIIEAAPPFAIFEGWVPRTPALGAQLKALQLLRGPTRHW